MLTRLLPVSAIHIVIKHLNWNRFVFVGHSMGGELGLFYNAMYPGKISRFILLDVRPGLQRLQVNDLPKYFKNFYQEYYTKYTKYNIDDRVYTKDEALQAVMKARGLTRDQAELVLARNLKELGNSKYKLSWDKRQRNPAPINFPLEFYIELLSKDTPPSLYINAKTISPRAYVQGKAAVDKIYAHLQRNLKDLYMIEVEGGHDVHLTNPERLNKHICAFLDRNFDSKSKL